MSSPEKSGPGATASPRLTQRTIKLNPVSAPGFKPVAPPPAHREDPPLTKQASSSLLLQRRETKLLAQQSATPRPSNAAAAAFVAGKKSQEKPAKLSFLPDSDKHTASSSSSSIPFLPSPSSPLSPRGDSSVFRSRRMKTGSQTRIQPAQSELACDKQYEIQEGANVFEYGEGDLSSGQRARSSSRGDRIQVPSSRDSRSPSPMSRRKQMAGSTLSPVTSSPASAALCDGYVSSQEERRFPASRSPTVSPINPSAAYQSSSEAPQKSFASLGHKITMDIKTSDGSSAYQCIRSKGATTPATSLTAGGNSNKKVSNKIDINYCPASPLSPRKRQGGTGDNPNINEAFQENYRFFMRGGSNTDDSDSNNNNDNANNERLKRMFSPAPVRDIFSPMPSSTRDVHYSSDFLDNYTEINLPSVSVKQGKRNSASGIVFPAIRVENVDDKTDRKSDIGQIESLNDSIVEGIRGIGGGRGSRSITPSSGSSTSTSPSPTSPPPTEFSRFRPTRAKSTNTLLSAEASKVIDSWLSPTLTPTPPTTSSSSSARQHPDDARLGWRKSGSSSTSCLLSVPPPLIKRQTSEGRLVVGVPDALVVPGGDAGAGKKGMKSRGWSRSESNLFVRTGRPVGGAGEGGLRTEEDFEESLEIADRSNRGIASKPSTERK
ncbi:hypothetical protein ElyMa_000323900 [Elysia marginata]|uniref:Uncharacterized protein n=1 Tax=Elysia marginata TaxID=1093978 RepID=A0AAV4FA40_9GAST|nr:hypothetical protein ElyMa_000323900 [Elysia marginata]